jgi:eukaryotic-like serine/threonine-protein kinase
MTPEDRKLVDELFIAARALPHEDRREFLRRRCADRPSMLAEVESLLDHDAPSSIDGDGANPAASLFLSRIVPEQIGRYRILRIIGEGGMGMVFEAMQESPRRSVALKIVRLGSVDSESLRRFEYEAEALGRLKHPNIARIYEAGTALVGGCSQPFLAMELVDGRPLMDYVAEFKLAFADRIRLLQAVCEAVHHAHLRGVIHRDLKPANILVEEGGQPKVLDFGVARIADAGSSSTAERTSVGQLLGTIPYMSPEQAGGDPRDLDVRSDVYALGVVCYEVLAGRLPYDLSGLSVPDAVDVIRTRPAVAISSISREYRGDIETVLAKALSKDPTRRYQGAGDLADDLGRCVDGRPIQARRDSVWYMRRKWVRRHWRPVSIIVGIVIAIMAIAAVQKRQAARLQTMNQDKAAVVDLLRRTLMAPDPERRGFRVTVREMIDDVVQQADRGDYASRPLVEAAVRSICGSSYYSLGIFNAAESQLRQAKTLYEDVGDVQSEEYATCLGDWAIAARYNGTERAEEAATKAVDIRTRIFGPLHPATAESLNNYAYFLRDAGRSIEAEPMFRLVLKVRREQLGESSPETAASWNSLGQVLLDLERFEDAELQFQTARSIFVMLPATPNKAHNLANLADIERHYGRDEEALDLDLLALNIFRISLPPGHETFMQVNSEVTVKYIYAGSFTQAAGLLLEVVGIWEQDHSRKAWHLPYSRFNLGKFLPVIGEFAEGETQLLKAFDEFEAIPDGDPAHRRQCIEAIIKLYNKWEKTSPNQGYAAKSALWQAKLAQEPQAKPSP